MLLTRSLKLLIVLEIWETLIIAVINVWKDNDEAVFLQNSDLAVAYPLTVHKRGNLEQLLDRRRELTFL
jgi:hypothetical protein